MPRLLSATILLAAVGLAACDGDPSDPGSDSDVYGFSLRRNGAEIHSWDPGSFTHADTVRLAANDSIPVEFRWVDENGEPVTVSASSAELTVVMSSPGVARWSPDASNEFRGSFITVELLQPVVIAMRVELEVGGETVLETTQLPVKVSP